MSQTVNVTLGGENISVVIDGGNMGAGASVGLQELNQAVGEAKQAADDAEASANQAAQAVAGVPAIATAAGAAAAGAVVATRLLKVGTLSDLRDVTDTEAAVFVRGRTADGDGYAGEFAWIAGDQSANVAADPLSGVWVAPDGQDGSLGAWKRQYAGPISPEWFGAKGDGVTDDSAAFQAAFNLARGGAVFLDSKHYRVGGVKTRTATSVGGCGPKVRLFGGVLSDHGTHLSLPDGFVGEVWTDIDPDGDDPMSNIMIAGGAGCRFEGMSFGHTVGSGWADAGIFIPAVRRTTIRDVNTIGRLVAGVHIDATWGVSNAYLRGIHPDIDADDGAIETRIDNGWLQGLWAIRVVGTIRDPSGYNASTWVWSPAGVSDLSVTGCRLGADRDYIDVADRAVDGGGLDYSVRTISGSTGNRGWRASFVNCSFRSMSKYQIKLDYAHRIAFIGCEGETPSTSGLSGAACLSLTANTGDISFITDNCQMPVEYGGSQIATHLYECEGVMASGARFTYIGRDGRIVLPNLNAQTATNTPEVVSGASNGQIDFASRLAGIKAMFARFSTLSWRPATTNTTDLGSPSTRFARIFGTTIHLGTGIASRFITCGSGSPEGVVEAAVGSMYLQTNGGAGTTLWIKESGTGDTGWASK